MQQSGRLQVGAGMTILCSIIAVLYYTASKLFLQSNEVGGSYHNYGEDGLDSVLSHLYEQSLDVDVLVTDRHRQINKWL